ncbi:hypothetical protein J6590_037358 [Homalodisca vitripennis]|nr:hypothetical protein J6590_037358 [Homalodisca vitripennis]
MSPQVPPITILSKLIVKTLLSYACMCDNLWLGLQLHKRKAAITRDPNLSTLQHFLAVTTSSLPSEKQEAMLIVITLLSYACMCNNLWSGRQLRKRKAAITRDPNLSTLQHFLTVTTSSLPSEKQEAMLIVIALLSYACMCNNLWSGRQLRKRKAAITRDPNLSTLQHFLTVTMSSLLSEKQEAMLIVITLLSYACMCDNLWLGLQLHKAQSCHYPRPEVIVFRYHTRDITGALGRLIVQSEHVTTLPDCNLVNST